MKWITTRVKPEDTYAVLNGQASLIVCKPLHAYYVLYHVSTGRVENPLQEIDAPFSDFHYWAPAPEIGGAS